MSDIKITDNSKKFIEEMEKKAIKAMTECGLVAEGYAKLNITQQKAVDTGLLRNSITFGISGQTADTESYKADKGGKTGHYSGTFPKEKTIDAYVGTNVEYAPYIEFGTGQGAKGGRKTTWKYTDRKGQTKSTNGKLPRPYLKPAIADHASEYQQIINTEMKS